MPFLMLTAVRCLLNACVRTGVAYRANSSTRPSALHLHERRGQADQLGARERQGYDGWARGGERACGSCGQRWRRQGVIRGLSAGELRRGCTSTRACERLGRVGFARDLHVLVVSRVAVAMRVHAERRRERPLCDPCARVG